MVSRKSMRMSRKIKKNSKSKSKSRSGSLRKSKNVPRRSIRKRSRTISKRRSKRRSLKGGRIRKALGHTVTAVGRVPIAVVDAAGKSVSGVAEGAVDIADSVVNHTGKYISGKRSIVNMPSNVVKGTVGTVKGVGKGAHSVVTGLGSNISNAITGKRKKRGKNIKNRFNHGGSLTELSKPTDMHPNHNIFAMRREGMEDLKEKKLEPKIEFKPSKNVSRKMDMDNKAKQAIMKEVMNKGAFSGYKNKVLDNTSNMPEGEKKNSSTHADRNKMMNEESKRTQDAAEAAGLAYHA